MSSYKDNQKLDYSNASTSTAVSQDRSNNNNLITPRIPSKARVSNGVKYCPICDDISDEENEEKSDLREKVIVVDSGDHKRHKKETTSQPHKNYININDNRSYYDDSSDGSIEVLIPNSTDTVTRIKNKSKSNKNTGQKRRRMQNNR